MAAPSTDAIANTLNRVLPAQFALILFAVKTLH
jgi:hypothetical protein